ncbi:MAG TPA: hypothetical protein VLV86_24130 [Vicinamibacterales bacterium]|nr:hypothetical protein [Vicinamibacterales bacterium]
MSSADRELPDFPEPTAEERLWLRDLIENPPLSPGTSPSKL